MEADLTPDVAARADRELLRAFVERADGAAFAELVSRHGPLVLGVCRRVLADAPDAEDAFQAAFLILARKANTVRRPERLAAWLYGVALRCAYRARKAARRAKGVPMPELPAPAPPEADWADVRPVLDAEIGRLPEKLRAALVLCELQGLDRTAAAERLGVPIGTLSSRLSRAKEALRRRLVRRGITLSLVGLGLMLTRARATAAVPPPLAERATAAGRGGTGRPAAIAAAVLRAARLRGLAVVGTVGVIVLALLGAALWGGAAASGPATDQQRIQGQWRFVTFRHGGVDMLAIQNHPVTIDGQAIRFGFDARYSINPAASPREIDVDVPVEGGDMALALGVYELTDDRLTIHLGSPGMPRPPGIEPVAGLDTIVLVFERIKD